MNDSMHDHHHHHEHDHVMPTAAADDMSHDHHHDHVMPATEDLHAHHHNSSGGHDGMMMQMYFYASAHSTILFKGWTTSDWAGMLLSCLAIFVMAALYEGLKVCREVLLRRSLHDTRYNVAVPTSESTAIVQNGASVRHSMLSWAHLLQTLLHVLQVVISYFLMLIFMTYNVYLCVAVALGAGCGYFLFAWKRTVIVDINEHCH